MATVGGYCPRNGGGMPELPGFGSSSDTDGVGRDLRERPELPSRRDRCRDQERPMRRQVRGPMGRGGGAPGGWGYVGARRNQRVYFSVIWADCKVANVDSRSLCKTVAEGTLIRLWSN